MNPNIRPFFLLLIGLVFFNFQLNAQSIKIFTDDNQICNGESALITSEFNDMGENEIYNFKWKSRTGENGVWVDLNGENETLYTTENLIETTSFKIVVTLNDEEGPELSSEPLEINVFVPFEAGSVTYDGDSHICSGTSDILYANPSGGSKDYTVSWIGIPNSDIDQKEPYSYDIANLTKTTIISYWVTDLECDLIGKSSDDSITIEVYPPLNAGDIISSDTSICYDEDGLVLAADPNGGSGEYDYKWYKNNIENTSETEVNYSVGPLTKTTNFYYKVEDKFCTDYSEDRSNTKQIIVNPLPYLVGTEAKLWVKNNPDIESQPLVLIVCCAESGSNYSYKWFLSDNDNDVEIPGETGQYYYNENGFEPGIYYAIVENEFGCTVETKHEDLNGLKEFYVGNETNFFVIYPNPSNGQFEVKINEINSEFDISSITLNIYSITGERIYSNLFDYSNTYIQLSNLNSGMYYLELRDQNNQRQIEKLIIQ